MFGYIIVNKAEMKFKEFDIYHSFYCGICRDLKRKYGVCGQISLSYDMTFLAILLTGLYEPQTRQSLCKCALHPFESHEVRNNTFTEYAADMNVLFTCYKCHDDWEDEKKFWKLLYGRLLEKKTGKLKERYAQKLRNINLLMQDFSDAEKSLNEAKSLGERNSFRAEQSAHVDIDTLGGLFGRVMAEIVTVREDEWAENLRRFGFFLGKFIYLCDAYEDVEMDIRKGTPNPLKCLFSKPNFEDECRTILMMMMSECCKEFEKLPILENVEILRNILYSGVWCRYESIREKREQSRRSREQSGESHCIQEESGESCHSREESGESCHSREQSGESHCIQEESGESCHSREESGEDRCRQEQNRENQSDMTADGNGDQ